MEKIIETYSTIIFKNFTTRISLLKRFLIIKYIMLNTKGEKISSTSFFNIV